MPPIEGRRWVGCTDRYIDGFFQGLKQGGGKVWMFYAGNRAIAYLIRRQPGPVSYVRDPLIVPGSTIALLRTKSSATS